MYFSFTIDPYVAMIGDMKDSKKISNRDAVQAKLKKVLQNINELYAGDIAAKFTITLGDEFQGLLYRGANAMAMITEIERQMYPVKIRFGLGIGAINTEINRELAIGADGPGYHRAREAIAYLKQNEKRKETGAADIRIEADGEQQPSVALLNTILSLLTAIKSSWSDRQRQTIWVMLAYQDSQANAAKRLGITQSSVQKNLAKGNFYAYKEALRLLESALSEIGRDDV